MVGISWCTVPDEIPSPGPAIKGFRGFNPPLWRWGEQRQLLTQTQDSLCIRKVFTGPTICGRTRRVYYLKAILTLALSNLLSAMLSKTSLFFQPYFPAAHVEANDVCLEQVDVLKWDFVDLFNCLDKMEVHACLTSFGIH